MSESARASDVIESYLPFSFIMKSIRRKIRKIVAIFDRPFVLRNKQIITDDVRCKSKISSPKYFSFEDILFFSILLAIPELRRIIVEFLFLCFILHKCHPDNLYERSLCVQ